MYHLLILGLTAFITETTFGSVKRLYKSTNVHRQLEPHYLAEMEYKKKIAELEALEEDDEDDEDDDEDEDDDDED